MDFMVTTWWEAAATACFFFLAGFGLSVGHWCGAWITGKVKKP